MSRSSLRTVTNINIDGQAVNAYNREPAVRLSFKVNCDSLSWVKVKYYDNTDSTSKEYYYPKGGGMIAKHNGDTFIGSFGGTPSEPHEWFKLGHDYTGVFTIYQNYPKSGDADNAGPGKYDVLLGSGRVQADSLVSNEVYIDKDIQSIKPPVYFEDSVTLQTRLVGGCMLQIDGVQRLIESYNPSTGKATLASAIPATAGKLYYLVSNYLECDPFYWYCRSDPTAAITCEYDDMDGITVSGVYSQAQDVAMQSYQFSCDGELGDKNFTYDFDDAFPLPCSLGSELQATDIDCEIYSQENAYAKISSVLAAPSALDTNTMKMAVSENTVSRVVRAYITNPPLGVKIFLWRAENGRSVLISTAASMGGAVTMYDRTAEYGKSYTYTAVCSKTTSSVTTVYAAAANISPASKLTKLSALSETRKSYHRRKFTVGDSQIFDIGGEQNSIDQKLGSDVFETEAGQPGAIYSDCDYESGTLTVYADRLGSIESPIVSGLSNKNILEKFIASKQPFLMLDNAGNSRIVALTFGTREYDKFSLMTKLTLRWTEICKTENAIIG